MRAEKGLTRLCECAVSFENCLLAGATHIITYGYVHASISLTDIGNGNCGRRLDDKEQKDNNHVFNSRSINMIRLKSKSVDNRCPLTYYGF